MNKLKILLIMAFSIFFTSCSTEKNENVWIVGTSADNPPYEFMRDGEIVGFDIDLITEIGRHLGKKIEFKNMEFHSLLAALSSNNVDMVLAGLSITPDRQGRVEFSLPYTSATIAVLFRKEDNFQGVTSINQSHKIGAQLGTIYSHVAHDFAVKYQSKVNSLSSNLLLIEELKAKRLDAIVLEESQAENFIKMYPKLSKFLINEYSSSFAIALPRGSKLKTNIDHTIKSLKSQGALNTLEKKWGLQ
jgi:polar amino acid transport system substrate-binding protein